MGDFIRMNGTHKVTFSPESISGISVWYDGKDLSTLTLDGSGNVTQWDDKSGNGRHATQTIASEKPFYNTTDNRVQFDGTNDHMDYDGTFLAGSNYTVFVHQSVNTAKNENYYVGGPGITNASLILGYRLPTQITNAFWNTSVDSTVSDPVNTEILHTYQFDISNNNGKQGRRTWNQKTELPTFITFGGATPVALSSYNNAHIGALLAINRFYDGEIAEMIIYNRALTDAEILKVQNYIFAKWA